MIVKQVLTNLLDNAIKHSETGGAVRVVLGMEYNCMFISVENSGPGIPREERENIWERFYKVDKSRSRRGTGTDLGLSIVKKSIESMMGKYWWKVNPAMVPFLPCTCHQL